MIWTHVFWIVVGLILGIVHTTGIWRSAKHPSPAGAILGAVRLLVVGLGLAGAAVFGGIIPATAGWAGGFMASVVIVVLTRPHIVQRKVVS